MSSVRFENVLKVYEKNIVGVRDLTLEIKDKEFFVLVGPSGCGKSTALRLVAGLEEPTSGNIYIGERLVNNVLPKDRDCAMVFQNYALYPHMTAYDNMAFGLKLRSYPKSEIDKQVRETAKILGIEKLLSRKPKALSGGERQRVAVGRAIVRNPKVFLFDEPLSNLDAKLRIELRTELARLHQRLQTTTLYVTHDQVEAMTLGERIGVMRDGRLHQVGNALELYELPKDKFVAGFIGSPPMNFIDGFIKQDAGKISFVSPALTREIPVGSRIRWDRTDNRAVIVGIRPEHILLSEPTGKALPKFRARVEVVEPMGQETIIYLRLDNMTLTGRIPGLHHFAPQENLDFFIDIDKVHFFDKLSEERIG